MMIVMIKAEIPTNKSGQAYTVFTADKQLHCVVLNIIWIDPQRFSNFIPRTAGMHWLMMSFVGSVGIVMKNSGFQKLMKFAFAGTEKMLTGKKCPMNKRFLRFFIVEFLRGFVDDTVFPQHLDQLFKEMASKSVLPEHWAKNLIKLVFLMMLYIRTEGHGKFGLHLYA